MKSKILKTGAVAALALAAAGAFAGAAAAHHSFSMFDQQKKVTLDAVVKEFQWTNPHSWIQVMVKDEKTGELVEWSVEAGSPNQLVRQGWARLMMKPGDKVMLVINPLKNGDPGGSFVSGTVNGAPIGRPRA